MEQKQRPLDTLNLWNCIEINWQIPTMVRGDMSRGVDQEWNKGIKVVLCCDLCLLLLSVVLGVNVDAQGMITIQ